MRAASQKSTNFKLQVSKLGEPSADPNSCLGHLKKKYLSLVKVFIKFFRLNAFEYSLRLPCMWNILFLKEAFSMCGNSGFNHRESKDLGDQAPRLLVHVLVYPPKTHAGILNFQIGGRCLRQHSERVCDGIFAMHLLGF